MCMQWSIYKSLFLIHKNPELVFLIGMWLPSTWLMSLPKFYFLVLPFQQSYLFFFFLIRGKKCEESMSEAHSLLKTSALKWHTYVHIALKRTQSQGQTPCKRGCEVEFWPFCLAVIVGETGVGGQQRLSGTAQSLCNPLCCNEGLLVCSNKSLYTFFLSRQN